MELPRRTIPVRPIGGMVVIDQAQNLQPEQSPSMQNFQVYQGLLRKRPGYVQYPQGHDSLGGRITGIFSTHDVNDTQFLFATWAEGVALYDPSLSVWNALTGTPLTGLETDLMSFANSQDSVVFSQGVDAVQIIALTSPTSYAALDTNAPPAKHLTRFADRLFLEFTIEGGVPKPYRLRWSVSSDHTDWTGIGSGFRDNSEDPYFLKNFRKLQTGLAVYTERSILVASRTGVATAPARYDQVVPDTGLYAANTLSGFRESHFFLGNDNFYAFNGGAVTPIGDAIRDLLFKILNPAALDQNWSVVLSDTQEYLTFLCENSSNAPSIVWAFNYGRGIWYPWTVSGHTAGTLHRLDQTITIDSLTGTIDQQAWTLNSVFLANAYPALVTGTTDGKLYRWGIQYPSDDGEPIDAFWCSKDFTTDDVADGFPRHFLRCDKVVVSYQDSGHVCTLLFSWSADGGDTWSDEMPVTFGGVSSGALGDVTWFHQITQKRIRVRVRNNSASETPLIVKLYFDLAVDAQKY